MPKAGIVQDRFCADEDGRPGPSKATGLAYDAETNSFYVGDEQSNQGAIWQMKIDRDSGELVEAQQILSVAGDRVTAVAFQPQDGDRPASVLYTTKRSTAVMRIVGPRSAPLPRPSDSQPALARWPRCPGDSIYIAESSASAVWASTLSAARRSASPAQRASRPPRSSPIPSDRLYVGTGYDALLDDIVVVDLEAGGVETYETGFAAVTGLGLGSDGDVRGRRPGARG